MVRLFILFLLITVQLNVLGQKTANEWSKIGTHKYNQEEYQSAIIAYNEAIKLDTKSLPLSETNRHVFGFME